MSITIEQAIQLYKSGTAVVVNDGKVSLKKESGHRVRAYSQINKLKIIITC